MKDAAVEVGSEIPIQVEQIAEAIGLVSALLHRPVGRNVEAGPGQIAGGDAPLRQQGREAGGPLANHFPRHGDDPARIAEIQAHHVESNVGPSTRGAGDEDG